MKFPLENKKKKQLKKKLAPIKKEVRQLGNPKLLLKTKRKLLKKSTSWIWCFYCFSLICYPCTHIVDNFKMSRNIFYISNVQSELFPHNMRTKFDQYIDVHNLNYIKQGANIEVAVKAISFDHKQLLNIVPDIYKPHFIFNQTITYNEKDDVDSEHVKLSDGGGEMINIESPSDFIFTNHCSVKDIVFIKSHKNRDFSNLMIVTSKNCIIHNIYMHRKEYYYLDTFINHVNSILKSITFYHDKDNIFKIDTDLVNDKHELNALSIDILIHEDIASVLGIYAKQIVGNAILDYPC